MYKIVCSNGKKFLADDKASTRYWEEVIEKDCKTQCASRKLSLAEQLSYKWKILSGKLKRDWPC